MYKEPFASREANEAMKTRITQKMEQVAGKLLISKSDEGFAKNLLDLCILNRMAESHQ